MNILLINHYAGSKYHGMEYRPYYLSREWLNLGHSVTIVAASYSHLRFSNPKLTYSIFEEEIDGIRYIWLKTPSYHGNNARRVLNILTFIGQLFKYRKQMIRKYKPEYVIASSTYPLDIIPAYYIARSSKAKLILEVHDLWPLTPMEIGGMSRWHPFIKVMQWAENFAYKKSDAIVSLLPKARDYMVMHGMHPGKYNYIPNGIVMGEVIADEKEDAKEHLSLLDSLKREGMFIVGYAGAHGAANCLQSLIDAAEILRDQPVAFVLVGQGPEKANLQCLKKKKDLNNVYLLDQITRNNLWGILARFDCCYIGLKKSPLFKYGVSPNKLLDYMAARKPVIYSIEAGNNPVEESGCGISVPPEDPRQIGQAIMRLMSMSEDERELMGERGREYVKRHLTYEALGRQFAALFSELNKK